METIVVELIHERALRILEELEDLQILKVVKKNLSSMENLSGKFRGKLPKKTAVLLQEHISESRNAWNKPTF